jgi:hypothetical protein
MALEILDVAFMFFGGLAAIESAEIAAFARGLVFLARIEAVFSGFELSDHHDLRSPIPRHQQRQNET